MYVYVDMKNQLRMQSAAIYIASYSAECLYN